jgi:hypothetical protein
MKFNEWTTQLYYSKTNKEPGQQKIYNQALKHLKPEEYYRRVIETTIDDMSKRDPADKAERARSYGLSMICTAELQAQIDRKPYFKLWPGIVPYLAKLDLSLVEFKDMDLPYPVIQFQFAEGEELETASPFNPQLGYGLDDKFFVRTVMFSKVMPDLDANDNIQTKAVDNVIFAYVQGFRAKTPNVNAFIQFTMRSEGFTNLGDCVNAIADSEDRSVMLKHTDDGTDKMEEVQGSWDATNTLADVFKVCCGSLLLSRDKDTLIEADVLKKDLARYLTDFEQKYVDRAHRNGKVGWNVGREMDKNPHFRRGHFMILKAGVAGRALKRFVWRKGHVVKREVAKEVHQVTEAES